MGQLQVRTYRVCAKYGMYFKSTIYFGCGKYERFDYDCAQARQTAGQGKAQLLLAGDGDWCQSYNFVAAEKGEGSWNQF